MYTCTYPVIAIHRHLNLHFGKHGRRMFQNDVYVDGTSAFNLYMGKEIEAYVIVLAND